jgi:hypothetical protein
MIPIAGPRSDQRQSVNVTDRIMMKNRQKITWRALQIATDLHPWSAAVDVLVELGELVRAGDLWRKESQPFRKDMITYHSRSGLRSRLPSPRLRGLSPEIFVLWTPECLPYPNHP